MATITESFKQLCPHCEGDGFTVEPECCGKFNSNDFVDKICCLKPDAVAAQCAYCKGTGFVEAVATVRPGWLFPEIMQNGFTL